MKKLLLSVAALVLATILLSLDDSKNVEKTITQDTNTNIDKPLESES